MTTLPKPSAEAQIQSQALTLLIQKHIAEAGGWISFAEFMQRVLYTPCLGYYTGGAKKFGLSGDFVTAPEISPLFAKTLAKQVAEVLANTQIDDLSADVLELGAGTGKLASDLLMELETLNQLPNRYYILEVSDYLRQVQRETLQKTLPAQLLFLVEWLTTLPQAFIGVMLGNEVLDAIPVHIIHTQIAGLHERGVAVADERLIWQDCQMLESESLQSQHLIEVVTQLNLPNDYVTEVNLAAVGLITSLAKSLQQGVILMIDYGFSAQEYYHPQRNLGTLMCHYQHYAHTDPLIYLGLQDVTAHVDFTSIAQAGVNAGLNLSGFCSQAQFLINCGLLDLLSQVSPQDMARYAPLAAAAQKLLSPAEMGDLFKVICMSKNIEWSWLGFVRGDKSYTL
ncbi:MAG: SAM-dependent methyltransferase [Methylophilaceae bacterium]